MPLASNRTRHLRTTKPALCLLSYRGGELVRGFHPVRSQALCVLKRSALRGVPQRAVLVEEARTANLPRDTLTAVILVAGDGLEPSTLGV